MLTGVAFKTSYAFRALLSRGFTAMDQVTDAFIRQVRRLDRDRGEDVAADILYRLTHVLERDRFANIQAVLDCLLAARDVELGRPETLPATLQVVARVIVTPTRLVFLQPEIMYGNRVLREFGTDHFLRVVFRDEDFSKLQATGTGRGNGDEEEKIFVRVRKVLKKGIKVGNRLYEFLAASNSQLREHGLWFFASDGRNRADSIRDWMGDFSNSRCPATYLARMGQCFSTTESSVTVRPGQVSRIADIEGGRDPDGKSYCFSDGIGKISRDLAKEVCEKTQRSHEPSAFQVRYAGVKGMLAVDPTLTGLAMQYRKSMEKFSSEHNNIEICSESHPARFYLNRQIISILSGLGIPDEVFQVLQEDQLRKLASMFLLENRAVDALNQRAQLSGVPYQKLSNCGVYMTSEPFFKGMLRRVYKSGIGDTRRKARIEIPPEYGRNMLGVLDETGTLEYGQVFVQYTEDITDKGGETKVLTGDVVVSRNPCFHPGDVRKLRAVDVPALHHMVDVIVFPSKGPRPHPNEMSGGDLDGDQFFVTWHPDLLFQRPNADPMHFKAPKKIELEIVTISDLQNFIVDYIKSDILGVIANAHLAFSDKEEDGVFSQVCLNLAEKHSDAVDFPKTGVPVGLSDDERPKAYPDFMDKSHKKTVRRSEKAMGEMYRECQAIENICSAPEKTDEAETIEPDPYLILPTHQRYKRQAEQSRGRYNDQLKYLMDRYGIETEAEAMSGCIGRIHKHMDNRYDRHEVERVFKERIKDLRRRTREEFFVEFGGEKNVKKSDYPPEVQAKASAWYVVTYSDANENRLLSFPWIVGDILAVIKVTVAPDYPVSLHPSADHITAELETIYSSKALETVRNLSVAFKRQSVQHQVVQAVVLRHPDTVALIAFLLQWAQQYQLLGRDVRQNQISQKSFLFLLASHAIKNGFVPDLELVDYTLEWSKLTNDLLHRSHKRHDTPSVFGGIGLLCVDVFRYLGSHTFVSARGTAHIVADTALMLSEGCAKNVQRQALRAYHLLSQTGDIGALIDTNITQRQEEWSRTLPPNLWKNYVSKRIKQVEEDLAKKTGAEVHIRPIKGRRPRGRVSGSGSHDAILRLESEVEFLIQSNPLQRALFGMDSCVTS
ncbi:probable RNA-dependent RNA polymerase 1 [Branchiostoma floridae]|uniref:RNA-dependent RNA polymerase n=1 Tax=Branchiostoma floridae TaxID=7739 RepID=A0A9J7M7H1_BRAFL|nr:probable RNA-dependent RNA polymerase 1 [Branchiostoma floridae]